MVKNNHPKPVRSETSRTVIEKESSRSTSKKGPEADAKGQFARTRHGSNNDGVVSAKPRVLSGNKDGDATFPLKRTKPE